MIVALRGGVDEPRWIPFRLHRCAPRRLSIAVLLLVVYAAALAGCERPPFGVARYPTSSSTPVPLPSPALLTRASEPKCAFDAGADPAADERAKLDYERQCYRHAEIIARHRLALLQNAVRKMIVAAKQRGHEDGASGRVGGYTLVQQAQR
jgi:hypothetical protein